MCLLSSSPLLNLHIEALSHLLCSISGNIDYCVTKLRVYSFLSKTFSSLRCLWDAIHSADCSSPPTITPEDGFNNTPSLLCLEMSAMSSNRDSLSFILCNIHLCRIHLPQSWRSYYIHKIIYPAQKAISLFIILLISQRIGFNLSTIITAVYG